jgi:hypothetical protein
VAGEDHLLILETVRGLDHASRFVVTCGCGWTSEPMMTAGMADALGTWHLERASRAQDRTGT